MARNNANKHKRAARSKKPVIKALLLVLVGLLLAVPAVFVDTMIGYVPVVGYLFTLLLCRAYVALLQRSMFFDQKGVQGECLRGEKMAFKLDVANNSFLPAICIDAEFYISDLFGGERETTSQRVSLPPRSNKTFGFAVQFDHIGTYQVGIRSLRVGDPFGIFSFQKESQGLQQVTVQPRIVDIAGIEISTESNQEAKRSVVTTIDEGMDYATVREYRWGDPIKSIHWKLSARLTEGEYLTRLYETSCNPGVEIFLDFETPGYDAGSLMDVNDALIESGLSIEMWASQRSYESVLLFVDDHGQNKRFEGPLSSQSAQLVQMMPCIAPGGGAKFVDLLQSEAGAPWAQNNFIVCSSNVTDDLVNALVAIRSNRRMPIFIAIAPRFEDDEQLESIKGRLTQLALAGVPYTLLSSADELEGRG